MSKPIKLKGEKMEYTIEYTRRGLVDAERVYNSSLMHDSKQEFESFTDLFDYLEMILFAGLEKNLKNLTKQQCSDIFDDLLEDMTINEVSEKLQEAMGAALNPPAGDAKAKAKK